MDLGGFLLMRQELVLLAVILLLVILEIFMNNKRALVNWALVIFGLHTLIGFLPLPRERFLAECTKRVS